MQKASFLDLNLREDLSHGPVHWILSRYKEQAVVSSMSSSTQCIRCLYMNIIKVIERICCLYLFRIQTGTLTYGAQPGEYSVGVYVNTCRWPRDAFKPRYEKKSSPSPPSFFF